MVIYVKTEIIYLDGRSNRASLQTIPYSLFPVPYSLFLI